MLAIFITFSEQLSLQTAASEFTGNSHSFYHILFHVYVETGGGRGQPSLKINFFIAKCYSYEMGYRLKDVAT